MQTHLEVDPMHAVYWSIVKEKGDDNNYDVMHGSL